MLRIRHRGDAYVLTLFKSASVAKNLLPEQYI